MSHQSMHLLLHKTQAQSCQLLRHIHIREKVLLWNKYYQFLSHFHLLKDLKYYLSKDFRFLLQLVMQKALRCLNTNQQQSMFFHHHTSSCFNTYYQSKPHHRSILLSHTSVLMKLEKALRYLDTNQQKNMFSHRHTSRYRNINSLSGPHYNSIRLCRNHQKQVTHFVQVLRFQWVRWLRKVLRSLYTTRIQSTFFYHHTDICLSTYYQSKLHHKNNLQSHNSIMMKLQKALRFLGKNHTSHIWSIFSPRHTSSY